ncbi:hypothetical protein [Microbacterium sp. No. 7]|uniref:hypothetical protein n=1 Tax=Microbacterium sp. No. 7 TaxID=1714373 RepID=UPI0006D0D2C8|nr:hypothetical protein [Microbacterium sp. No. 7]ALJ19674.1 hypothetical protein AOA12_07035 [Microbacterium sp. No. 7]
MVILESGSDENLIAANPFTRVDTESVNDISNMPATVVLDGSTTNTQVIYSTTSAQLQAYSSSYAHVPMP